MSCCTLSARAVCYAPLSTVNRRPLRDTRWDAPPSFRFRPHNTLGCRPPGPRGTGVPHTGVRSRFELPLRVNQPMGAGQAAP
jgi:hypothetical protein